MTSAGSCGILVRTATDGVLHVGIHGIRVASDLPSRRQIGRDQMATEEAILEKVRRLFELAKSSNEHESAAAAAKAQELLHKYNLSQADIPTSEKEPYIREIIKLKNNTAWAKSLYNCVAKANGGYVVQVDDGMIATIGQRHNLDIIEYIYSQLEYRIRKLSETAWDLYGDGREAQYKASFAYGAIERLRDRLNRQKATIQAESKESMALIVVQDRELNQAVASWYPRLRTVSNKITGSGYALGQNAGSRIGINAGLTAGVGQRRLG